MISLKGLSLRSWHVVWSVLYGIQPCAELRENDQYMLMESSKEVWMLSKDKMFLRNLPGGPVVKNPPCDEGDSGSIPHWETKIPPAMEQQSLRDTVSEVHALQSPYATTRDSRHHNKRSCMTQQRFHVL